MTWRTFHYFMYAVQMTLAALCKLIVLIILIGFTYRPVSDNDLLWMIVWTVFSIEAHNSGEFHLRKAEGVLGIVD